MCLTSYPTCLVAGNSCSFTLIQMDGCDESLGCGNWTTWGGGVSMLRKHNILLTSEILVQTLLRKAVERSFGSCLLRYPFGEIAEEGFQSFLVERERQNLTQIYIPSVRITNCPWQHAGWIGCLNRAAPQWAASELIPWTPNVQHQSSHRWLQKRYHSQWFNAPNTSIPRGPAPQCQLQI